MNQLIEGRKLMAKMMKQLGKGKMPALPGAPQGQNGPTRSATKKKKKSKRKKSRSRR